MDIAAEGGGSENKTKFVMLNPSDSIVDWVIKTDAANGRWLGPPGMLGIGIGGTAEGHGAGQRSADGRNDIHELIARGPQNRVEELPYWLYERSTRWASAPKAWAAWPPCWT